MSTETATQPYRLASGEGLADAWWKSGRVTIKAGPDETGNAFSQLVMDEPRGSGTPIHIHHNEDETFYVLEGEVTVLVGDERIDLGRGDYCYAPRGVAHADIVRSERARFLTTISPAGLEQLFVTLGIPVTDDQPPSGVVMPPMDETLRLFAGHGVEIVGPPPTLDEL